MKKGKSDDVSWGQMGVLADDVLTLTAHVNDQAKRTLEVLSDTDAVHTEDFAKAFDSYNKGLCSALNGARLLQDSALHLQSAYETLHILEEREGKKG